VDIAVDPLEGQIFAPPARQTPSPFSPQANAAVFFTLRIFYHGENRRWVHRAKAPVDLDAPVSDNLKSIAKRLDPTWKISSSSC